jgi:ABC-2 type transport system permease protein
VKLREIFRYELAHRLGSASTWVYAAILFALAFSFNFAGHPSDSAVHANAPVQIAIVSLILGLFGLLVSAALFGDAAVRDVHAEMDPLLFTSPLRKVDYLGGRFLAALAINGLVLVAIPLGLAASMLGASQDPAAFGPFRVAAYLQPYLIILLPNMVFAGAVLFTTGVLARKTIPVYLAAIGLFIGTMITLGPDADDNVRPVLSVLGPLGFHALNEVTRLWTAAERNARLIGFPAHLLWNRVVWLMLAATVLAVLDRRFRFAHPDGGGGKRRTRRAIVGAEAERVRPAPVPLAVAAGFGHGVAGRPGSCAASQTRPVSFGFRTTVRQTLAVARRSLVDVTASRWFIVVLLACAGLTMLWGWNVADTVFDTSTWPVTLLVAGTVLSERIVLLIYALIAIYSGELVWKDRDAGEAEIVDAAPVPGAAALAGRFLALVAMLAMFQAACMAGGILIQAFQGYTHLEIGLYLRIVFGLNLADFVLLAALAMTIHILVNHKYLGHMIVMLAILLSRFAAQLGIRHHLLRYGSDPGWTYSDMNGFGPFIGPFVWFKLYWAAWALLLAVVAVLLQVRGREPGVRHRLHRARSRFTGPVFRTAGVALALILLLGGFIFYNTNILNDYSTTDETGASQAEYEKRYSRFAETPQPVIAGAELRIEIYPDEPAVDLLGAYHLVNRTAAAIDSVHVFTIRDIRVDSITFDRDAEPVIVDDEVGYRIYVLERALEPGDSMRLSFDVAFRPHGFPNSGIQTDVVGNGAYFNRTWLPFIGYQPAYELADGEARQRFDLEPRPPMPGPGDKEARRYRSQARNEELVQVDAVIGTAADQTAVTLGVLRRSWTENGRRYFHYVTEAPTSFGGTVFSGEYTVLDDRWNDVALQIFHHPAHIWDLGSMVRSMKASLDYYSEQFGPYPDSQLRILEIPRYGGFGHAHPHTIAFTEDAFLSRVREGEIDQPFYGTAHEVAHQWWARQVGSAAGVRGQEFLSESLANYSAMMVTEKVYGAAMARRVYDFQMQRYLTGRASQSREVPLLEVEHQPYIAYRKGAIAMYTLREQIGEERVNTALHRFLDRYRDAGPPYRTSLDLYAELRAVTPDSLQYVLADWFETITLWDVATRRASVEPTGTGEYQVTLDIVAKKMRADSIGNETEVPMDDLVEIGVYAPGEGNSLGEPLHLKRHRIHSGEQTIRITVPREPARAGIDPRHELVDRRSSDNIVALARGGPPS